MALILDQSSLFGFVNFASYTGQSTNSFGTSDIQISLSGTLSIPTALEGPMNTTALIKPGYNTYYKLQGWNPLTQKYEFWHSMNVPLTDPPSGNALQNISVIGTWKDR